MTAAVEPLPVTEEIVLDDQHPWPGLASFHEGVHSYFRGRDNESAELFRLVESSLVTVFYGVAGLGKTSLLQAGLFPRLRNANGLPVPVRLDFRAGAEPLVEQVFDAIERELPDERRRPARRESETFWEFFHRRDAVFWNERHRIARPVLVFDQFEELFTLGRETAVDRAQFLEQIADLGEARPPARLIDFFATHPEEASRFDPSRHRYAIIFSLREDYLAELDALRPSMRSLGQSRMRLVRMDGEKAREVLDAGRAVIDPETALSVVRFAATGDSDSPQPLSELEVDPALLSVICSELNLKRIAGGLPKITRDLLDLNRDSILHDFFESAIQSFPANVRTFVEEGLLTPNGYRASMSEDQAAAEYQVDPATLHQLVGRRLVRIEARGRAKRIELTHDLLTKVIVASRDRRRQIEKNAAEEARVEAEKREAWVRARLRLTNVFLLIALAALVTAGVFWLRFKTTEAKAAHESAQWLFRAARDEIAADRHAEALAFLASAMRVDPKHVESRRLALNLLLTRMWYVPVKSWTYDDSVVSASVNGDGSHVLAVLGKDVFVIDVAGGKEKRLTHDKDVSSAEFIGRGDRILTETDSGVRIWNVADGKLLDSWMPAKAAVVANDDEDWMEETVESAVVSLDGSRFAIGHDGALYVRMVGGAERRIVVPNDLGHDIRFSPDATMVGIASRVGEKRLRLRVYDAQTGALRSDQELHATKEVREWALSPTLTTIAVLGADMLELLEPRKKPREYETLVTSLVFSPDGGSMLGIENGKAILVRLADLDAGADWEPRTFGDNVEKAEFTAGGMRVVTTSEGGHVRVWSPDGDPLSPVLSHDEAVASVSMSTRGDLLLIASGQSLQLRRTSGVLHLAVPGSSGGLSPDEATLYVRQGKEIEVLGAVNGLRRPQGVIAGGALQIPREGSRIGVKDEAGWSAIDTSTGKRVRMPELRDLPNVPPTVRLLISGNGERGLLVRTLRAPSDAIVYDFATGAVLKRWTPFPDIRVIRAARISHDGKRFVLVSMSTVTVVEVDSGRILTRRERYGGVEFDHSGTRLTVTQGRVVRILDAATLEPTPEQFSHPADVSLAVLSRDPEEKYLVALQREGGARIWQRNPQKALAQLRYRGRGGTVEFSPDGRRVLIEEFIGERELNIWDSQTGVPVMLPMQGSLSPRTQFGALGRRVAAVEGDMLRVVDLAEGTAAEAPLLADLAEAVAGLRVDEGTLKTVERSTIAVPANAPRGDVVRIIECFTAKDRSLTPFTDTKLRDYIAQRLTYSGDDRADVQKKLALVYPR